MTDWLAFLKNLPATIWTFLTRPSEPTFAEKLNGMADITATLADLILSQTESFGPMPGTGGMIHRVSRDTAHNVAVLIVSLAPAYGLHVSLPAALIRSESDFDPHSIDPNDQDAKPGETPEQALLHADLGLAQEDVKTAAGDPANKGLTLEAIEAKMYDPKAAVYFVCQTLCGNLTWAKDALAFEPWLATRIPRADYRILACQAYNAGRRGAMNLARNRGTNGNWSYGTGIVTRADSWAALLN